LVKRFALVSGTSFQLSSLKMAVLESRYIKVAEDTADAEPATSRRMLPAGLALFFLGSSIVLVTVMVHWSSGPTELMTSKPGPMNLVGLSSSLRPSNVAGKRGITNSMSRSLSLLPGSGPFKKLAISALEANNLANNLDNRVRDISMMAKDTLKEEVASSDDETKETVAKMEQAVVLRAQDMAGVTGPMGFFDPLGFSTDCPPGKLLFYREVELKHGLVAMVASLGILVAEQFHPLFGGNIDVPSAFAFQQTPLQGFWQAVLLAIGLPEVFSVFSFEQPENFLQWSKTWTMKTDRLPGDLGWDPLGLKPTDPAEFKVMQTKELNNGRLAMIAAAGMLAQELASGQKIFN
jgi:hypothetical protein